MVTKKNKRGRPATGENAHIAARADRKLTEKIDAWADAQSVNRAEAIRRLIRLGLLCPELPADLSQKIEAFASHHGLSRGDAVRRLIESGLIEQISLFGKEQKAEGHKV